MGVYRFVVIGAGMAGASAAYELAAHGSVLVLEQEGVAGYHTTGRSVAIYSETYGNATIRAFNSASRAFLLDPPADFTEHKLLTPPHGELLIGRAGTESRMDETAAAFRRLVPTVRRVSAVEAIAFVPALRRDWVVGGIYEPGAMHMDVDALHQGYLRGLKKRGGAVRFKAGVRALEWRGDKWRIETSGETLEAETLVNAAGAWADEIAGLAGARKVGLTPKRRTAAIVPTPTGIDASLWPFVIDFEESFYFKPESGRLLVSPAEETDIAPCDVYADDYDVAVAIDRIRQAANLEIIRVERSWAGLRSFVADRSPVVGYDAKAPNFIWCAGQGGYGIQAAPAIARATAALALYDAWPDELLRLELGKEAVSAERSSLMTRAIA